MREAGKMRSRRPVHWGAALPLADIVRAIATHHVYHAGEINQLLSIQVHE
jgi:hypothetical protein